MKFGSYGLQMYRAADNSEIICMTCNDEKLCSHGHLRAQELVGGKSVLGVVEDEPFRDALDRFDEALLADATGVLGTPERGNVIRPGNALSADEADVPAFVRGLRIRD